MRKSLAERAKREGKPEAEFVEQIIRMIPMGRVATTEDVAGLVAFLIFPDASYITRTNIDVCDGFRVL